MPTPALLLSRLSFVGLAKETTQGTYVAPTFFVPGTAFKPEDITTMDLDTSMEGNVSKVQGSIAGEKDAVYGLDHNMYFETVGNWFTALGHADTVSTGRSVSDGADTSSTTITSATAAFVAGDVGATITGTDIPAGTTILSVTNGTTAVLTAATTGTGSGRAWVIAGGAGSYNHKWAQGTAQPTPYSITDYNVYETRGWPGCVLDSLDLTVDSKSLVKVVTAWKGWPSATQSKPTPAYPALPSGHGWQASLTIGGTANTRLLSLGLSIKRSAEPIHTAQNSQNPYNVFAAEIEGTLKLKLVMLDNTDLNQFLNNSQPPVVLTITSPTGSPAPVLTITMSKVAFKKGPVDRSGKYNTVDLEGDLVNNSTDGGIFKALLANGVVAAY